MNRGQLNSAKYSQNTDPGCEKAATDFPSTPGANDCRQFSAAAVTPFREPEGIASGIGNRSPGSAVPAASPVPDFLRLLDNDGSGQSSDQMARSPKQAIWSGIFIVLTLVAALKVGWHAPIEQANMSAARSPAPSPPVAGKSQSAEPPPAGRPVPDIPRITSAPTAAPQTPPPSEVVQTAPVPQVQKAKPASRQNTKQEGSGSAAQSELDRSEEVQRLRAQAYSETRRERLRAEKSKQSALPAAKPNKPQPSAYRNVKPDLRRALAQCSSKESLFEREGCKWRLCNGRWGKNGCPSYNHEQTSIHHIG